MNIFFEEKKNIASSEVAHTLMKSLTEFKEVFLKKSTEMIKIFRQKFDSLGNFEEYSLNIDQNFYECIRKILFNFAMWCDAVKYVIKGAFCRIQSLNNREIY